MKIILPSYINENSDAEDTISSSYLVSNGDGDVETMVRIDTPLPVEKRIFDGIDISCITMPRVRTFIDTFSEVLRKTEIGDVSLTAMRIERTEDEGYELEWIYNYFRVYYSFEVTGDDTCGFVESNQETGSFNSSFRQMQEADYKVIAEKSLIIVINHIQNCGVS